MKSALFIRGGAIGDFILTLPALHVFREHHPDARLEIMGYPHIIELAHRRFYATAIRSMDHRSAAGFFAARGSLDPTLCAYFASFEVIVSYLYDPDSVFFENLKRAGASRIIVADGRPTGKIHASEHLASWLTGMNLPSQIESPKLYPTTWDQENADRIFPRTQKTTVALHLGSGSPAKNWPTTRFVELAVWLKERGLNVLVLDGPADSDVKTQFWKDPGSMGCIRCHRVELPMLAGVSQRCAAFVGHDSGISHLCAAVGTPTIAIFGGTDPMVWGPRGKSVTILQKGMGVSAVAVKDVKIVLEPHVAKAEE